MTTDHSQALPDPVRSAGTTSARELDVRAVIAKGGDPFRLILSTTQELADDEALHLIVGFEPRPLFMVMSSMGRAAHVEQRDGVFHVWFYKSGRPASAAAAPTPAPRAALKEPVELDVRGLEPPQPMIRVLETLTELGDGAQLLVRHHREPVLLYDKLELRGYAARATKRAEDDWVIHIAPSWAFEQGPR